jgi:hypothetical protein
MERDRGDDTMSDPTPQQIKDAILKGLKDVGEYFAKNPRPTDGSVRAGLAIAEQARRRRTGSGKRVARAGKSP